LLKDLVTSILLLLLPLFLFELSEKIVLLLLLLLLVPFSVGLSYGKGASVLLEDSLGVIKELVELNVRGVL